MTVVRSPSFRATESLMMKYEKATPVESLLQRGGTEIPFERALLYCQDRSLD
jgi:hypothetical protein